MNQQSDTMQEPVKTLAYAWVILFAIYMATLALTLNLFKVPPVMSTLIKEFNLSYSQAGLIMSSFSIRAVGLYGFWMNPSARVCP